MFTGIIEEVGTVTAIDPEGPNAGLTVKAQMVLADTQIGDSISVNGACLTVTTLSDAWFSVGVMPETLRRTGLGRVQIGRQVNLERATRADGRLGGHIVQGHVDGVGAIVSVEPEGSALAVRIETAPEILRYIVEKGFVAVDGASLTVTGVDNSGFGIGLIPYTQEHLAPAIRTPGQEVNLEVDILAKYLEKLVVDWRREGLYAT
jgi:riboflavin synthase